MVSPPTAKNSFTWIFIVIAVENFFCTQLWLIKAYTITRCAECTFTVALNAFSHLGAMEKVIIQ